MMLATQAAFPRCSRNLSCMFGGEAMAFENPPRPWGVGRARRPGSVLLPVLSCHADHTCIQYVHPIYIYIYIYVCMYSIQLRVCSFEKALTSTQVQVEHRSLQTCPYICWSLKSMDVMHVRFPNSLTARFAWPKYIKNIKTCVQNSLLSEKDKYRMQHFKVFC